jgi:toxin YoeB
MRSIVFTATALKDFVDWAHTDTKLHQRIATLIFDILRDPFQGLGNPGAGGLPFELQPTSFEVAQDFRRLLQLGEGLKLLANVAPVQFAGLPNDDAFHVDPVFGASRKRFHHHQVLR